MTPAAPPLRMLFWESTAACNLHCAHCRRLATDAVDELTSDQAKLVFASAKEVGPPVVVFSGGEPLIRNDWEELAAYCKGIGLTTALATNGTLIDAAMAARIAAAGFHRVSISFDGADAATHDAFRGQAGAFEAALAAMGHLKSAGVATQVNATITTHNADQLDRLHALATDVGAVALHLFLLVPVGCGAQLAESQQITAERYEEVLHWIADQQPTSGKPETTGPGAGDASAGAPRLDTPGAADGHDRTTRRAHAGLPHGGGHPSGHPGARTDGKIEVRATCGPHYYRVAAERGMLQPGQRGRRGCLCGVAVAFVSHRGQVFPCGYLPVEAGDVRQQSFAEIWRTSGVFADLRDNDKLTGRCGACRYKAVCGGCRARAYAATGDYLAEEPTCLRKGEGPEGPRA